MAAGPDHDFLEDDPEAQPMGSPVVHNSAPRRAQPAPKPGKSPAKRRGYSERFETFWAEYPVKVSKPVAYDKFQAAGLEDDDDLWGVVVKAIADQKADRQRAGGNFYPEWPHPERWLKHQRWADSLRFSNVVTLGAAASNPEDARLLAWMLQGRTDHPEAAWLERQRDWCNDKTAANLSADWVRESHRVNGFHATLLAIAKAGVAAEKVTHA